MRRNEESPLRRRHWLCIAYAFPPINRSGTHRTLGFVEHLDRLGWDATVLTVVADGEPIDESLNAYVPQSTTVIQTGWTDLHARVKRMMSLSVLRHDQDRSKPTYAPVPAHSASFDAGAKTLGSPWRALRDWGSRWLVTPDTRLGWIAPALRAGLKAVRRNRPEILYSTSPYTSAHLIGFLLSIRTGIAWVADFRDPWRDNPFRAAPRGLHNVWDSFLERLVLKRATHVVCCTPTMTAALRRRRPCISGKCSTILNAFDGQRYESIKPLRVASNDQFLITHAGQFYGSRSPVPWLRALGRAIDRHPELRRRVRLSFIGGDSYNGRPLADWAKGCGLEGVVQVLGRLSHAESLRHLAGSDAFILAGSSGFGAELQVPNKLFEYLALRKPIIASCPASSPIVSIIEDAKAEAYICRPDDIEGLATGIIQLANRRRTPSSDAWAGVDLFERSHRARELAEVFSHVATANVPTSGRIVKTRSAPIDFPSRGTATPLAPDASVVVGDGSATSRRTCA